MTALRREAARVANIVTRTHWAQKGPRPDLGRFDDHFFSITQLPQPVLYNALSPKVGLLAPLVTLGVVRFYQRVEEARYWLPLLRDDPDGKIIFSPVAVLRPLCAAVEDPMLTLLLMQKDMNAERLRDARAEELDIKGPLEVVEEEDRFWEERQPRSKPES